MSKWLRAIGRWGAIFALTLLQFVAWITGALALAYSAVSSAVGEWCERHIAALRDSRWLIPALIVSLAVWVLIIWGVASFVRWVIA
ncbi:MAG: hypothetical protein LCH78_18000 [Proteobacteria bacterium]|nr:hypothetical protein [Pseudomonadota bacterium]